MRIARIARPGAIYDASASVTKFSAAEMIEFQAGEFCSGNEGKEIFTEEDEEDFDRMPDFAEFKSGGQEANKVNILKSIRKLIHLKRILL